MGLATFWGNKEQAMSRYDRPKRQEFKIDGLPAPLSHYTDAVRFGDILFVSGLTAHNGEGKLVGGDDAAAQTRQILLNLKLVLDAAGATMADVLKVTVFLTESTTALPSIRCGRRSLARRGQPAPSSKSAGSRCRR
jgi:enamine deaminase RidA (YjgF/YER057c/UK114 family)